MAAQFLNEDRPETIFGAPKAGLGMWASVVRIINPITGENLEKISLDQNEAAHRYVLRVLDFKQFKIVTGFKTVDRLKT